MRITRNGITRTAAAGLALIIAITLVSSLTRLPRTYYELLLLPVMIWLVIVFGGIAVTGRYIFAPEDDHGTGAKDESE